MLTRQELTVEYFTEQLLLDLERLDRIVEEATEGKSYIAAIQAL